MPARLLLRCIGSVNLFVFGVFTLLTLLFVVPLQVAALPWDPHRKVTAAVGRAIWGVGMIRAQPFWRLTITGTERLGRGPYIVIANHQSMLDIPLLMNLPLPIRVGARPGVFRMPVFGHMARFGHHVRIDPEDPQGSLAACRECLARGISMVLFPEGQRGDGSAVQKFHRGAFELALQTGATLLPVAISGTAQALPKGSAWARVNIARFHLQILEPIPVVGRTRRRIAADAQAVVENALVCPRPWQISERLFARYRSAGRFRAGFAAGKTKYDPIFWTLLERLPRAGRLLDVGAGEGLLGLYLREGGSALSVHGLDVDATRIAAARQAAGGDPGLRFEVADGEDAPYPEADVVTCIDVLHYLPPDRRDRMIQRLCATVAPNGVLYIRDPAAGAGMAGWWTEMTERVFVALGRHRGAGVHVHGADALVAEVGRHLVDVRVERSGSGPFANVLVSARRPGVGVVTNPGGAAAGTPG
jgi:1-acyl-sn-glycerol-3-phosphate acyltransferase